MTAPAAPPGPPLPLDANSISITVISCPACVNGRRDEPDVADPEDFGIGGCCEGYGVALDIPEGLEPLVLFLAANAAGDWASSQRGPLSEGVISEQWCEGIEEAVLGTLELLNPLDNGAKVAPSYQGSEEQMRDSAIQSRRT